MKTELSYLDLVLKLYDDVQSDECMPTNDRRDILELIEQLGDKLEKYSY